MWSSLSALVPSFPVLKCKDTWQPIWHQLAIGIINCTLSRCSQWVWEATRKGCFGWHAGYSRWNEDGAHHFLPTHTTSSILRQWGPPASLKLLIRDDQGQVREDGVAGHHISQGLFPSSVSVSPGTWHCFATCFSHLGEYAFATASKPQRYHRPVLTWTHS